MSTDTLTEQPSTFSSRNARFLLVSSSGLSSFFSSFGPSSTAVTSQLNETNAHLIRMRHIYTPTASRPTIYATMYVLLSNILYYTDILFNNHIVWPIFYTGSTREQIQTK